MTTLSIPTSVSSVKVPTLFLDSAAMNMVFPAVNAVTEVTSSDTSVATATIDASGEVTISRVGTSGSAIITARSGGITGTVTVEITVPVLAIIEFDVNKAAYIA